MRKPFRLMTTGFPLSMIWSNTRNIRFRSPDIVSSSISSWCSIGCKSLTLYHIIVYLSNFNVCTCTILRRGQF